MKNKSLLWLLVAANLILLIVCAVLYLRTDRKAPELAFSENDTVYRSGMKEEALLAGVTAYDNRDGDVTDRVVVEKISENHKENKAVVFYAVSDRRNNVARASREFAANYGDSLLQAGTELLTETAGAADTLTGTASVDGTANSADSGTTGAEATATDGSAATGTDGNGASQSETPTPEPTETPEPTTTPTPTASAAPTRTPRPTPAPQAEVPPAEVPAENAATPAPRTDIPPTLTLKVNTVKVAAGSGPAWVDVIRQLSDDKDSYETLFHNLTVSKYDRNTPGTYSVTVQTKDSDGNVSAAQPLTIIVE